VLLEKEGATGALFAALRFAAQVSRLEKRTEGMVGFVNAKTR